MKSKDNYKVIGLMSGTSLDGLDIACCEFLHSKGGEWRYHLIHAESRSYPEEVNQQLKKATALSTEDLLGLHVKLGRIFGNYVQEVVKKLRIPFDFIASHGHTIFHQPENGYTWQIGNGYEISKITGIPVVCDFRSKDVSLGGQGAPLVPIGDRHLFGEFGACVNLGGISNISFENKTVRKAFDICPVNMILNPLANIAGFPFDRNGELARAGGVNEALLTKLKEADIRKSSPTISLGYEWVSENILSLFDSENTSIENKLSTSVEYITDSLASVINSLSPTRVLMTGGGTHNNFLIEQLKTKLKPGMEIIKPDNLTINFKEAIIFGFLGVLRMRNEVNCLSSVTGASVDSVGGLIYE